MIAEDYACLSSKSQIPELHVTGPEDVPVNDLINSWLQTSTYLDIQQQQSKVASSVLTPAKSIVSNGVTKSESEISLAELETEKEEGATDGNLITVIFKLSKTACH